MEGDWGRDASIRALRKLGGAASDAAVDGLGGLADLPGGDAVATVFGAVAERRRVRFQYRGADRLVDPWRLSYRRGQWYLAGLDHGREGERLFRLDRVAGRVEVDGPAGAFERPAAPDTGVVQPWRLGDDEEIEADLLVDVEQARWAEDALGSEAVVERRKDGSVRFRVALTNVGAFRSFVLGFLDHAEILGPPDLRAGMVAWLEGLAVGDG
jgi:predicted DNA-binding transcriptional regulator YafY